MGAVAYLSQSKYGKYGNPNYIGANKEVYINNSSDEYTGRSGGEPNALSNTNGTCEYDNIEDRKNGQGSCGGGASTTGNITGVYDMSGGVWEYVMGNYKGTKKSDGFSSMPASKYYDKYPTTDPTTACVNEDGEEDICYGHALSETSGWYNDDAGFAYSTAPWFSRGGYHNNTSAAGVFYFGYHTGGGNPYYGFRVVLVAT